MKDDGKRIDKNKFGLVISVIKELQDEEGEGRSGGKKDWGNQGRSGGSQEDQGEIRGSRHIGRYSLLSQMYNQNQLVERKMSVRSFTSPLHWNYR